MVPPFMIGMLVAFGTIGALGYDSEAHSYATACKVPHCRDCETEYSCYLCDKGFFSLSGQCIQCLKGFYPSEEGCAPCPEGCAECKSKWECSECLPGFEKDGGVCKACENYIDNCSVCSPLIQDFIFNGDFEEPPFENRLIDLPISNWHVYGTLNTNLVRFAPDGGDQSLIFDSGDEVYQIITELEPGETYTLSFYCISRDDVISPIEVTALGGALQTFTCPEFGGSWNFHTLTLVAPSEIDQVLFTLPSGTNNVYFDGVSLVKTSDLDQACPTCSTGFYEDMGQCTPCSDSNCSTCSSSVCFECKEGFAFNYSSQCTTCSELFAGCEECSSSYCKKCSSEYRLSHGNCFLSNTNCVQADGKSCKECKEGFVLYKNFCYEGEEVECDNGYLNDLGRCIECGTGSYGFSGACYTCPENCDECSDGESCTECGVGFEWKDGKCSECELYVENCSSCTTTPQNVILNGDFESPPYFHSDNGVPLDNWNPAELDPQRIRDPPDGGLQSVRLRGSRDELSQDVNLESGEEYTLTFYCLSARNNENQEVQLSISGGAIQTFTCPAYFSDKWVQYTVIFTGGSSTDTILFSISSGNQIAIEDVVLVKSSDLVATCSMCLEGFYPSENRCLPCSDSNCASCPDDVCLDCKEELLFDSEGVCKTCREVRENCEECSESGCEKCSYGYFNWNGQCYAVKNNCILSSDGACMSCLEGYFKMYEACYKSIEGCSYYDYYGNCMYCSSGRKAWNNRCF